MLKAHAVLLTVKIKVAVLMDVEVVAARVSMMQNVCKARVTIWIVIP